MIEMKTHGKTKTTEFTIWLCMIGRCENPNNTNYPRYGGRGIRVCKAWRNSFERFLEDMGERPSKDHSLDRINNDGDYRPENCKWSTQIEQQNNRSSNKFVTIDGVTKTLAGWSRETGMPYKTVTQRFRAGWDIKSALTVPRAEKFIPKRHRKA